MWFTDYWHGSDLDAIESGTHTLPLIEVDLAHRLNQQARSWGVEVSDCLETRGSVIAFGERNHQPVVLKLVKQAGDEWNSGEVLDAFEGHGFARVYEHVPGAILMERLQPGHSLASISLNGDDEKATAILVDVLKQSRPATLPSACPSLFDWAKGFDRYIATGGDRIPKPLVETARRVFLDLCESQKHPQLLHGDFHHYNLLFDLRRGWTVIDPKGVIGEIEYEIGAVLRNPIEQPNLFIDQSTVTRRLTQFSAGLDVDYQRLAAWGFAQSVLSAIWDVEDGISVDESNAALRLAAILRGHLPS